MAAAVSRRWISIVLVLLPVCLIFVFSHRYVRKNWLGNGSAADLGSRLTFLLRNQRPGNATEVRRVSRTELAGLQHNIARQLMNSSRVLCWVLTGPATIDTKGAAILKTWGPKCDRLLFMTSEHDKSTLKGKVALPGVGEGREELVNKSKKAWTYVHEHYANQYDWFYKCDDDTYAIVENLKFMLSFLDPAQPSILGMKLRPPGYWTNFWWMSGGPGYIFSRAALHKVVRHIKDDCMNDPTRPHEDQLVSICAQRMNIKLISSLDQHGKSRILPLTPELHIPDGALAKSPYGWVLQYAAGGRREVEGKDCCSDLAISFHYIKPAFQYTLHYLIYGLHPFGTRTDDIIKYKLPPRLRLRSK